MPACVSAAAKEENVDCPSTLSAGIPSVRIWAPATRLRRRTANERRKRMGSVLFLGDSVREALRADRDRQPGGRSVLFRATGEREPALRRDAQLEPARRGRELLQPDLLQPVRPALELPLPGRRAVRREAPDPALHDRRAVGVVEPDRYRL